MTPERKAEINLEMRVLRDDIAIRTGMGRLQSLG